MSEDNSWRTVTIGDLGRVVTGRTPPTDRPEYFGDHMPFITPTDMDEHRLIPATQRGLSPEGAKLLARNVIPAGVAVSCIGWQMGKTVLIDRPSVTNQQLNTVIPNPTIADMEYLYYSFSCRRNEFFRLASGGSRTPILKKSDFEKLPVVLPPLPEQRAIAAILGALDDKIELNRRMNATVEAMARAIFQSWFVNFDPVRAKAEGRETGLPVEIAAQFPDGFVESRNGLVPCGWRSSDLGTETRTHRGLLQTGPFGSQLHAADYVEVGIPSIMPRDIAQRRVQKDSIACVSEGDAHRLARHRVIPGDIVYSRRGDVERHALIGEAERGWLCGTGCILVRLGPDWPSPLYASLHLDQPKIRAWISQHAIGATMPNLSTAILSQVPVMVPDIAVMQAFQDTAGPLDQQYTVNEEQNRTLAALRDTLLPKLISGQLRVPEVAEIIESMRDPVAAKL